VQPILKFRFLGFRGLESKYNCPGGFQAKVLGLGFRGLESKYNCPGGFQAKVLGLGFRVSRFGEVFPSWKSCGFRV
jgi:hypothetical protein